MRTSAFIVSTPPPLNSGGVGVSKLTPMGGSATSRLSKAGLPCKGGYGFLGVGLVTFPLFFQI